MPRLRPADVDARALARLTTVRFAALAAAGVLLLGACGGGEDQNPLRGTLKRFRVESEAIRDRGQIPTPYTCDARGGVGLSPDLAWYTPPEGTLELAVHMIDRDAPGGRFIHWAVYGIDPSVQVLELNEVPEGAKVARNDFGKLGYGGPCPPEGKRSHRYFIFVSALRGRITLPDGAPGAEVVEAIEDLRIGLGQLMGFYGR